jgi:[protein-PII] uridylyltransferase
MDDALRSAFMNLPDDARDQVAVLALGGYGRGELCPKSDIDVMVLCESGRARASETAKRFLHLLWDEAVDIGHSVRTVEEAMALHGTSLDAWTSMLESRYLCGNERLAQLFFETTKQQVSAGKDAWLINGVFANANTRHERYGNSVRLLEPNIKKSAGGLRDFQTILWLHQGHDPTYTHEVGSSKTASESFLDLLRDHGEIEPEIHRDTKAALEFLFRVRHEMHDRRDSLHDVLEYSLQREVAEGLGYGKHKQLASEFEERGGTAVETFMREYYLHARTIHRFNQRLSHRFRELVEPDRHASENAESIGGVFLLHDDVLSIQAGQERLSDAQQILDAFAHAAENDVELDYKLCGAIERSLDLTTYEERNSRELGLRFRRILNTRCVAQTLRAMNELDVLGRYIPEFGDLVAFFQHNVYHYFTADEHTLIAIENAERLREQQGVMREVYRNLRRKDVLYLSILLHDIAKPRGVADHEITGVEMATAILKRMGMEDTIPDVAFLVRHHLLMEQVAFRRNIHDPETIKEFAAQFDRPERLDYLYLLTYADLSAVNMNVWTEWKSSMLQDLYLRTSEVLRRNLRGVQIDEYHHAQREAAVADVVDKLSAAIPREHVERHLQGIQNDAYISLFTEQEIGEHIIKTQNKEPISVLFSHTEGNTEVTIIARDAPFALSRFCAVLTANDANIFDANVFTRDDGTIIDRFRVTDASTKHNLGQRVCSKIADDLTQVVEGNLDLDHLFQAHRRKWKRTRRMQVNPNVRIDVEFEDNPNYTIIDVYAPDSVGFLYRVTEAISRLGLDIYFAKIATRVDGIVDAFYTLDRSGKPVTEPARREGIRQEILSTIKLLQEEELA